MAGELVRRLPETTPAIMFKAIIEFFRRLFGGRKAAESEVLSPEEVHTPSTTEEELAFPQDGAEISTDSLEIPIEITGATEGSIVLPGDLGNAGGEPHTPKYLWCLDNGHGEETPGKRSPEFEDGSRMFEWEFNRDINRRIMARLDEIGVQYHNVVPETTDISLLDRCTRVNNLASELPKLFVSIHANAFGMGDWSAANGVETWYMVGSSKGQRLASAFQAKLAELGMADRGIRFRTPAQKSFYVLRRTSPPAALTENGFYTNKAECEKLKSEEFRQKIAEAHVQAILEIEHAGVENIPIYPKNTEIRIQ